MTTTPVQPTALPDYPAAHSGDVTWFAVDTEGSVGVFRASQQSAIPWIDPAERDAVRREVLDRDISVRLVQQEQDSQTYDRSDVLLAAHTECESDVVSREIRSLQLDPVEIGFEVEECLHPWNEDWYGEFHDHDTGTDITALLDRAHLGPWLVWVLDIEAARAELDAGIAGLPPQRRRGSRGVVAFADLPSATARRLLLTGDCLGVKRWQSPLKIMEYRGELTQLGLHAYFVVLRGDDAGEFGWSSHQYLRDLFPAVPLRIERLSERAQRIAGRVRLPISFSESPFLQPELYVPCRRDVSETAFVERDGTPTARLLENRTYLDFLARQKRERDDAILAAMILAERCGDYPAAHSMDTTWFAVDGKGHVGCFHTGRDGVVPASWHYMPPRLWREFLARRKSHPGDCELEQDLLLQLARAAGEKLVTNRTATANDRETWNSDSYLREIRDKDWLAVLGPEPEHHSPGLAMTLDPSWCAEYGPVLDGVDCWGLVLVLEASFSLGTDFRGEQLFLDSERRVLLVEQIPIMLYRHMHHEGACLGCFEAFDQPQRMGVFQYVCQYRQWYNRTAPPTDPLLADQLPAALREYLTLVRLPASDFTSPEPVDLERQVYCVGWGGSFFVLDEVTNTVRPKVLDRKDALRAEYLQRYREAFPHLAAWARSQGYAIEPPPDDFPAGHSMDTTWFAVDRDGHVAVFDTGEDGAAPARSVEWRLRFGGQERSVAEFLVVHLAVNDSSRRMRPLGELLALAEELGYEEWAVQAQDGVRISIPKSDLADPPNPLFDRLFGGISWSTERAPRWPSDNILLKVASEQLVSEECAQGMAVAVSADHGQLVYFFELPLETVQRLEKRDPSARWFQLGDIETEWPALGLYAYDYEYWLPPNLCRHVRICTPDAPQRPRRPLSELLVRAQEGVQPPKCVCVWIGSPEDVRQEINRGIAIPLSYSNAHLAFFRELPMDTLRRLEGTGAGTGWFPVDLEDHGELTYLGLYGFGYTHYQPRVDFVPYVRRAAPATALTFDRLPHEVRVLIGDVRFASLCFADAPLLQPFAEPALEMASMNQGGCSYLDADLTRICPIRGREAAYRAAYPELLAAAGKCGGPVYVVPPDPLPGSPREYPAAHSMDTTWFAVDGKGQVGCFVTGPEGAVPASWAFMPVALWQRNLDRMKAELKSKGYADDCVRARRRRRDRADGQHVMVTER